MNVSGKSIFRGGIPAALRGWSISQAARYEKRTRTIQHVRAKSKETSNLAYSLNTAAQAKVTTFLYKNVADQGMLIEDDHSG